MSVNKTIGGLSVLSSANIKGCYSLPVWDSDAQTTKSACISDLVTAGGNIFTAGTGTCSSLRVGVNNTASECFSSALGGCFNTASGRYSVVGGGVCNIASNGISFVGSGVCNCATNEYSIVGGGFRNKSTGLYASVLGGITNCATGARSVVGGGTTNKALGFNSGVLSGATNCAVGDYSVVSGGSTNRSIGQYSSVLGGFQNFAYGEYSMVLNGISNISGNTNYESGTSFVLTGTSNRALSYGSGIISGALNCIVGMECSTISGGYCNKIVNTTNSQYVGAHSMIGGGVCNSMCTSCGTTSGYDADFTHNIIVSGCCNSIRAFACGCPTAGSNFVLGGSRNLINVTDSSDAVLSSANIANSILSIGSLNCINNVINSTTDPQMAMDFVGNSILSGNQNKILSSFVNPTNLLANEASYNTIVSGQTNSICINDSLSPSNQMLLRNNAIVSGNVNCIFHTCFAFGCNSSILSGQSNRLCSTTNSSILGGCANTISFSRSNTIAGGALNSITSVNCSMVFGQSNVVAHNYVGVVGCGITSVLDCALHTNRMVVTNMPTSSAGLPSGTLYSDAGTIKIVP